MKRCPECGREYDVTMSFCLDDGSELLYGPASMDEPATAILSVPPALAGDQSHDQPVTAIFPRGAAAEPQGKIGNSSERQRLSDHRAARPLVALIAVVLILAGGFLGYRYFKPAASEQINSLAVLPLVNQSGSADTDYLSDGLAESLIYRLSQLPNLKVSSVSSVMRYKGQAFDAKKVCAELGVQAVLSGRLMQRGDNMSISVELIDAATNNTLWGEKYDRKMADLLATQREIAAAIADKLQLKLSGSDATGITKKYTNSSEAYQLYLKGRFNWNKRTAEGLQTAVQNLNQAIEKDPGFALAYSALADAYVIIGAYGILPPSEIMPKAKAAALKAIELDSSLAEPHAALGTYYAGYAWDYKATELQLRKAIELNPNYATAWHWLGSFLPVVGKNDESIAAAKRAEELDPLSAIISADTGWNLVMLRRFDEAVEQAQRTLTIDANFWYAHYVMGMAYDLNGKHTEAVAELRKAVELNPGVISKGRLAAALARAGNRAEAQRLLNELVAESKDRYVQGYYFMAPQLALGDKDAAIASLEKDLRERGIYMLWLGVNPEFDELKNDPRFTELLRRRDSMRLE